MRMVDQPYFEPGSESHGTLAASVGFARAVGQRERRPELSGVR
jgi:hypothetical protein